MTKYDIIDKEVVMVYTIVINASLFILSMCAGLYTLFCHTDFPKGMSDDEIDKYRNVAANHSRKVRGCAATTIVLGFIFYLIIPALCILFDVNDTIICICSVLFAIVQMAAVQIVFTAMSNKPNV